MINIKIVTLGLIPHRVDLKKIKSYRSKILSIDQSIDNFDLIGSPEGEDWTWLDNQLEEIIPVFNSNDLTIILTNVPLELNYYARRLSSNRVLLTFHEVSAILESARIPLFNLVLRVLYAYTIVYYSNGNRIPRNFEITDFAHDYTRGCLFDMNGIKVDIIHSCHKPVLCPECTLKFENHGNRISKNKIALFKKEIDKIQKQRIDRALDFVRNKPIISLIISALTTITLGFLGALLYDLIEPFSN